MIEPGPGAPDTPEEMLLMQRNAFMESLSIEAKARFLDVLTEAKTRGMSDEAAWEEAVVAAETTYNDAEIVEETIVDPEGDVVEEHTLVGSPDPER
ncbi:MAG: hypothetical protein QOE90_2992 [Thermoplasmata archaeon]|jgi:hypothetical protein|nr:hypothetical protein [Thermoplasmata archaeon]